MTKVHRSLSDLTQRADVADNYKNEAQNLKLQLTSVQEVLKTHSTNMQIIKDERNSAIAESARLVEEVSVLGRGGVFVVFF